MIDWQQVTLNLRAHYKPLKQISRDLGLPSTTLQNYADGGAVEPKFSIGTKLLDLHCDKCKHLHKKEIIGDL
jgi:hypothetical protein